MGYLFVDDLKLGVSSDENRGHHMNDLLDDLMMDVNLDVSHDLRRNDRLGDH